MYRLPGPSASHWLTCMPGASASSCSMCRDLCVIRLPAPGHSTARPLQALLKAARDPRIVGVCLKISPVQAGWAKLQELRQYIKYFRCTA